MNGVKCLGEKGLCFMLVKLLNNDCVFATVDKLPTILICCLNPNHIAFSWSI